MTILEIFQKKEFREKLLQAITNQRKDYIIPETIPKLYKYSSFSEYSVKNILDKGISLSMIATFNDCYDSNLSFGNIKSHAIAEYEYDKKCFGQCGYEPCISVDEWIKQIAKEQAGYRGFCNDSYCLSLSQNINSTLMWSHYADCNRGICVEYSFEEIKANKLYHSLFPVCYTNKPIDVYDYLNERKGAFSIEIGIMISVLNKALCWEYEAEWRLVLLNESLGNCKKAKYISLSNLIEAKSITLGQNFLDNFIPELNRSGVSGVKDSLNNLSKLLDYIKLNKNPLLQMTSIQDDFNQSSYKTIVPEFLSSFITQCSKDNLFELEKRNYLYISYFEKLGLLQTE